VRDDEAFVLTKNMSFSPLCPISVGEAKAAHAPGKEVILSASLVIYFNIPYCINDVIINEMI